MAGTQTTKTVLRNKTAIYEKDLSDLNDISKLLNIPNDARELAADILLRARERNVHARGVGGKLNNFDKQPERVKIRAITTSAITIALDNLVRRTGDYQNYKRTYKEIGGLAQVPPTAIQRTETAVRKALELKNNSALNPLTLISMKIDIVGERVGLDGKEKKRAMELVTRAFKEDPTLAVGMSTEGLAAAALFITARRKGKPIGKNTLAIHSGSSADTVRHNVTRLQGDKPTE